MNIASVIGAVASISWLLVVGVIALTVVRASRGQSPRGATTMIIGAVVLAIIMTTISQGLIFIQPQERGVVISALPGNEGVRGDLGGGLNWIVPFFENVVIYPISRQTYTMSVTPEEGQISGDDSVQARTRDGQIVFVDASVIFAIDPTQTVKVHTLWQNNYVDNLIRPQARGIIRDAVALYDIEDVYSTQRAALTIQIAQELAIPMEEGGFTLNDFVLRNIAFSPEYAASVEQKQIAEQLAQQAFFTVEQRKQEAEQARQAAQGQADSIAIRAEGDATALLIGANARAEARIIEAEAEAEALALLAAAIKDSPEVLTLEYIQQLAPNISVMLLPADNPFLFPLPEIGPPATVTSTTPAPVPTTEPSTTP